MNRGIDILRSRTVVRYFLNLFLKQCSCVRHTETPKAAALFLEACVIRTSCEAGIAAERGGRVIFFSCVFRCYYSYKYVGVINIRMKRRGGYVVVVTATRAPVLSPLAKTHWTWV